MRLPAWIRQHQKKQSKSIVTAGPESTTRRNSPTAVAIPSLGALDWLLLLLVQLAPDLSKQARVSVESMELLLESMELLLELILCVLHVRCSKCLPHAVASLDMTASKEQMNSNIAAGPESTIRRTSPTAVAKLNLGALDWLLLLLVQLAPDLSKQARVSDESMELLLESMELLLELNLCVCMFGVVMLLHAVASLDKTASKEASA
jgi:hypothetical protein